MNRPDDTVEKPGDAEFAARVAARLRESAESLDGQTRSKLNRARQAALDGMSSRPVGRRSPWLAGVAAAAVAVVAVLTWRPVADGPLPDGPPALAAPDLELLMTDESLDMLEDLEFYTWLAAADLEAGAAG